MAATSSSRRSSSISAARTRCRARSSGVGAEAASLSTASRSAPASPWSSSTRAPVSAGGTRVRRVERARLLERRQRFERLVQARALHLREREPQRHLLGEGLGQVDPRLERLRGHLPAPRLLLEPCLERPGYRVRRVLGEHLADQRDRPRCVLVLEGLRRARAQLDAGRPIARETNLLEQRSRERPRILASRRRALEAEDGPAAVRVKHEDLLVSAGGARRVAEDVFPEERHLLEEGDLARLVDRGGPPPGRRARRASGCASAVSLRTGESCRARASSTSASPGEETHADRRWRVASAWRPIVSQMRAARVKARPLAFASSVRAASCSQVAMRWSCLPAVASSRSSISTSVGSVASRARARCTSATAVSRSPSFSAADASARSSYAMAPGSVTNRRRARRARAASAQRRPSAS